MPPELGAAGRGEDILGDSLGQRVGVCREGRGIVPRLTH